MADVELIAEKDMGQKENIAPCQKYVGWADIESVEYKYPPRNAVKYVLRITLVGSSPRVWREIAVPSNIKLTSLAMSSFSPWVAGEPSEYVQEMEKRVSRLYGWR